MLPVSVFEKKDFIKIILCDLAFLSNGVAE